MEPRLKRLDSGGLVGVIRKDLNSPLAVPENRCGGCFPLALFDRCAGRTSLYPPPAALGAAARHSVFGFEGIYVHIRGPCVE